MRKRDRRRLDPAHGVLTYPARERRAVPSGLAGRPDDRAAARRYPDADDRRRHERLGGRDRAGPHLPREQLPWRCRDHADRGYFRSDVTKWQRFAYVLIFGSLAIGGCTLAVTVIGSLSERKRPFSLLRLTGGSACSGRWWRWRRRYRSRRRPCSRL